MSASLPVAVDSRRTYGWSADGKSSDEISSDILQTRYRLDSDVRALREQLVRGGLLPAAALTGGLALLAFLIRRIRRRKR